MLDTRQQAILRAVVDRIVPPDADTPGGVEAGAADFLLALLEGELASEAEAYQELLDTLNQRAVDAYPSDFPELSPETRDSLLRVMEADPQYGPLFRRLVEQVQEGFYTSPAAWQMIGWTVRG